MCRPMPYFTVSSKSAGLGSIALDRKERTLKALGDGEADGQNARCYDEGIVFPKILDDEDSAVCA